MTRFVNPGLVALALLASVSLPGCAHHRPRMTHAQMEEMAQKQARLDALVGVMNAEEGPAKVDAIADVVNELASEHKAMHQRMQEKHSKGSQH